LADLAAAPADEQTVLARREVVDHCLYGVDKNPVAAEMAKLSLWLTTMAKERPFTFLDHAIQVGDSLLGITDMEQLRWLHLDPAERRGVAGFTTLALDIRIKEASDLARQLQELSVVTIRDATEKQRLHDELRDRLGDLSVVADAVVGAALSTAGKRGGSAEARLDSQLEVVRDEVLAMCSCERGRGAPSQTLDNLRRLGHCGRPVSGGRVAAPVAFLPPDPPVAAVTGGRVDPHPKVELQDVAVLIALLLGTHTYRHARRRSRKRNEVVRGFFGESAAQVRGTLANLLVTTFVPAASSVRTRALRIRRLWVRIPPSAPDRCRSDGQAQAESTIRRHRFYRIFYRTSRHRPVAGVTIRPSAAPPS